MTETTKQIAEKYDKEHAFCHSSAPFFTTASFLAHRSI